MLNTKIDADTALRQSLRYDEVRGLLYWQVRPVSHFASVRAAKGWNTKYSGSVAGSQSADGYVRVAFMGATLKAHRVAWFLFHGTWPQREIDHKNGVAHDNRIENLRDVSHSENLKNQRRRRDNTSGHTGVHWHIRAKKWAAKVHVGPRYVHVGYFNSREEAVAAISEAHALYLFSESHGA